MNALKREWPAVLCVVLLVGLLVVIVADTVGSSVRYTDAVVVDKAYTPSSTDVGVGVSSNGQPVTTVTSHGEKWIVIVRIDGEVYPVRASKERWAAVEEGQKVQVTERVGWLFGSVSDRRL